MKRSIASLLLLAASALLLMSQTSVAQSKSTAHPTSEQSLEALVNEVRQLRAMVQRLNKGQVILERLKLEQEQVARLTRELNEVRDKLSETRIRQGKLKAAQPGVESGVEAGAINKNDLIGLKAELDASTQREQRLVEQETQLSTDLNTAQARLANLTERLNALELELAPE
jgi:DNA repair exonuclease SbcCD ATPase subunit